MRVLCVLTSHEQLGDTGRQTGTWMEELLAPYYRLHEAGIEVEFASPKGGSAPLDPASLEAIAGSELLRRYEADDGLQGRLAHTLSLDQIHPTAYDAVLYPGGHGPLYDLRKNRHSIAIIEHMLRNDRPVGTICHAGAVLLDACTQDGMPVARNRTITAFTDSEEEQVGLTATVPYSVEAELRRQGSHFTKASDWAEHVVVDGMLITGQNPASARGVADAMIGLLQCNPVEAAAH